MPDVSCSGCSLTTEIVIHPGAVTTRMWAIGGLQIYSWCITATYGFCGPTASSLKKKGLCRTPMLPLC
ncbi:MAG: hypothetical protein ACTSYD_02970, partial [Candidatus Heimdallarchaeaceae archaeon]